MRPFRFLITLLTFILAFLLLLLSGSLQESPAAEYEVAEGGVSTYFNWRTPSSLFPPSAIISLTDDNSTFFLARPAAYGPLLPARSLSAQLWIGSGFGEDHLGRANYGAGAEGELGCSDVPGWDGGLYRGGLQGSKQAVSDHKLGADKDAAIIYDDEQTGYVPKSKTKTAAAVPPHGMLGDDGTDDHLHRAPTYDNLNSPWKRDRQAKSRTLAHADIEFLQESAEIAGKVVLLSRGGCGFLEKTKWVQRRGGIALIVGDDERGGPLVTMYARGDTSNITIPSIFTSHTTAHILSSLVPSARFYDDWDEIARLGAAIGGKAATNGAKIEKQQTKSPVKRESMVELEENTLQAQARRRWYNIFFASSGAVEEERIPAGKASVLDQLDWPNSNDYDTDNSFRSRYLPKQKSNVEKVSAESFRIGVHDWRDPDLMEKAPLREVVQPDSKSKESIPAVPYRAGSITPGSGQYVDHSHQSNAAPTSDDLSASYSDKSKLDSYRAWLRGMLSLKYLQEEELEVMANAQAGTPFRHTTAPPPSADYAIPRVPAQKASSKHHAELWVTLTPTSSSSSPFLDTLLVLVVSPLITLTVVYALLLLRSRMRRRRWRAPKSIVERLPVRTYQTIPTPASSNPSTDASALPSPNATTPLLSPTTSRPVRAHSRPRAQTVPAEITPLPSSSQGGNSFASLSPDQIEEKRAAGLAEWRRRYGGKQRECVVCLEEYVDGVSQVMSLPCGHEFHAECITPWLTTRRRTCPICKGDVVRSLARDAALSASVTDSHLLNLPEDGDGADDQIAAREASIDNPDEVQDRVLMSVNDDPVSQQPVSREAEALEDLERGLAGDDRRRDL